MPFLSLSVWCIQNGKKVNDCMGIRVKQSDYLQPCRSRSRAPSTAPKVHQASTVLLRLMP